MPLSLSSKEQHTFPKISPLQPLQAPNDLLTRSQMLQIGNASLETHIGSVLVLTEDYKVLYATASLQTHLEELTESAADGSVVTQEIILICQVLKQCRDRFPNQNWAIEFDIFTKKRTALHIRSHWLKLEGIDRPCILLVVENRLQLVQDIVRNETEDWGLTAREREVWLLHQEGYTYRQIAEKLHITINTVKKHMRSAHSKRKSQVINSEAQTTHPHRDKPLPSFTERKALRA
ncbi:MAG: sigma factor-like helix-turn-helix DNA-binding protein [Cyanobacteria bacterium P01_F01_bin.86]